MVARALMQKCRSITHATAHSAYIGSEASIRPELTTVNLALDESGGSLCGFTGTRRTAAVCATTQITRRRACGVQTRSIKVEVYNGTQLNEAADALAGVAAEQVPTRPVDVNPDPRAHTQKDVSLIFNHAVVRGVHRWLPTETLRGSHLVMKLQKPTMSSAF